MPVYLMTSHAYRSWSEDHPKGFIQRDQGLQSTNDELAAWRAEHSNHEPAKFPREAQELLLDVVETIAAERKVRLHGASATQTHVHKLISFRSPACTCGASDHCNRGCPARTFAEEVITRMKRKMGQNRKAKRYLRSSMVFSRLGFNACTNSQSFGLFTSNIFTEAFTPRRRNRANL
jgi:hypothetical protein